MPRSKLARRKKTAYPLRQTNSNVGAKPNDLFAAAVAHHQGGRLAEAESLYKLIIGENPNHYMGLNNLGLIDASRGRNAEAEVFYRRALAINDNYAEPLINLGNLYHARKKFAEATLLYHKALQIDPDSVAAHVNFGNLLRDQGNYQEAAANYNRALALNPDVVEAHLNLGNILVALGDLGAAIDKYRVVINMRPESADAYTNLGATLLQIGKIDEARAALEHALQLEPDKVDALLNLGNVFVALGQTDESVQCCRRILEINPDHAGAQANVLAALNYCDSITPEEVAQQCLRIGEMVERRFRTIRPVHGNIADPDRRLRIGYVSPDFRKHAVAYFLEPLFSHDRRLVEIFCYAEVVAPDHITERFMLISDHWLSILGVSDEDLAERIRQDGIDILIDLAGHTENTRLPVFARRPAPVQMTWLGYPNTTGFHSIDYRLVDAYTDPPGRADHLASETLLRIDGGFLCYHPLQEAPPPVPPPCLDNGFVTFGSFNKLAKISSAALDLWGRLLVRVPTARLLLKSHFFAADDSKARFLALLDKRGVAPDRVILVGPSAASADQLRAYHQVDIALDSFPYNGTTTTCEALWMGVPVVALAGESHCGRTGVSLLTQVGVAELIAHDQDDYIRIAANLAEDTAGLTALHARLRGLMAASPFCDAPAFARKLEAVYRTTWRRWCETRSSKHEDEAPEQLAQVDAPTENRSFPLRLSDGSVLALPASLDCITTYIVLEQEIWFEKEAGFPSQWLKPGMTAIDIGAHVGVYSLPMARAVGPSGRVVAYEPSRAIVELLKQSQKLNDATCLSVVQAALSDRRRTGHLVHADCSELNRLGETGEPVTVSCLDHEDLVQNWNTPDFVKIDAAGEEASILRGGNAFFTRHSPLVMFAASSDADVRLPLCEAFYALGYRIYRLLAGAPVLVPDTGATLDAYEINLFAAKPDRAASLAQDGWLAEDLPTWHPTDRDRQQALEPLRQRPCAVAFADLLRHDLLTDPTYRDGLAAFAAWRSPALPLPTRCAALEFAWQSLMTLNQQAATHARLLTLARVAWEAGQRALCVQALRHFLTQLGTSPLQLNEPFWPPAAGFDLLKPVGSVPEWVTASATEQLERSGHHSSGYTGQAAGAEWLCTHSFGSAEMQRRRVLVRARAGQRMEIPERLCVESEDHLNALFWRTGGVPNTVVAAMGNPAPADRKRTSRLHGTGSDKRIVVDGHYFRFAGGIARAWTEILAQLQDTALGRRIVLLDRGFVPGQLNRLETTKCPPLDYDRWQDDRRIVQELCDELDAALFISTYYTRPKRTPSLLMVYDMIPERNGFNLSEPQWQQKHDAINYAAAYTAISENTRTDLLHYHPAAAGKPLIVNYLGVSSAFHASEASDKQRFFQQFVVPKLAGRPYIMFVGGYPTYKNNGLLFAALSRIDCSGLALLMTAGIELVDKFRQIPGLVVHAGYMDEASLRLAYSCADFLVYPSFYEGAGLPILEAMACRCPVICANTSSMPELAGQAALLIDPNRPDELVAAMSAISSPVLRQTMIERGVQQAQSFRWEHTAQKLEQLIDAVIDAAVSPAFGMNLSDGQPAIPRDSAGCAQDLTDSALNRLIAPEIKADAFYTLIKHLAATEVLENVLEIGSSSGGGSTEAFVAGLSQNLGRPKLFCIEVSKPRFDQLRQAYQSYPFVHCYNRSTVSIEQFPSAETVAAFHAEVPSNLQSFPLSLVLGWLRQDIQYVREAGVESSAIEAIKAEHGIKTFDMVLIDGSEFTGEVEFGFIAGAGLILLDDTNTFKCHNVRLRLLADPAYDLIADDQTLRNGFSAFRRRTPAMQGAIPHD